MKEEEKIERILQLKKEINAVILVHNYQIGEVQETADFLGDSLDLSIKAAQVREEVILFCGVHFMAETAAILSKDKTVLIPDINAGCPMADMITPQALREWKQNYPGRKVVCYVNTSAEVKAECDICCTSANAVKIVESLDDSEVLFVPDRNLGAYIDSQTDKKVISWDGYCYVHDNILAEHIREKKNLYPGAEVWVHPECRPEVIGLADKALSTGQMVREASRTESKDIIIGTESGIIYRLKKENPDKNFYPAKDSIVCSDMKKINLDKVLKSLEEKKHRIEIPHEISRKASIAIERMIKA